MTVKEKIKISEVVEMLNEMLKIDQEATSDLVKSRVKCNEGLAEHPTIQVSECGNTYEVGLIGVLNGIFGIDENGFGHIAYEIDKETKEIKKFKELTSEQVESFLEDSG